MNTASGSLSSIARLAAPLNQLALPLCTGAAIIALWQVSVSVLEVPAYILPTPSAIAVRFVADVASGEIVPHFLVTLTEVLLGLAAAATLGLVLGTLIGIFPAVDRTIYPIILVIQTIPKVAIAPLLIIWFGYGISSKVVTTALLAFFPILVNVIAGIKTVDARRLTLMRMLCATPLTTFLKVRLPNMLTYLFAGLEVGVVLALIGAIVGEFVGASEGLGSLLIQRQAAVDVSGVFSILVCLSLMGLALTMAVKVIRRRIVFWEG